MIIIEELTAMRSLVLLAFICSLIFICRALLTAAIAEETGVGSGRISPVESHSDD